jgi:large conductance mechanosensitive channel
MENEKKGFLAEFKEFIMRGNVMDMAIGVIIATAFGKITTSLVNDVCMPLIGMLIGGIDLGKLDIVLKPAVLDASGEVVTEAVTLGIGTFLTTIIDFILVALVVFLVVKGMNKVQNLRKKEEEAVEEAPPEPSKEELLLTEIRDLLKEKD